jgi:hypothetical protein
LNYRNHLYSSVQRVIAVPLLRCFCIGLVFFSSPVSVLAENSLIVHKNELLLKLDSLDMEKQLLKRQGQSIETLEKVSDALKDSVTMLKLQMGQDTVKEYRQPAILKEKEAINQEHKVFLSLGSVINRHAPKSLFDWIVGVIALVAIISGIVLITGVVGMFTRKSKKVKSSPSTLRDLLTPRQADKDYTAVQAQGSNQDTSYARIPVAASHETINGNSVDEEAVLETVDDVGAMQENRTELKGQRHAMQDHATIVNSDLKNQVVKASLAGLSAQEISRKLHVSVDQVALIVRLAQKPSPDK